MEGSKSRLDETGLRLVALAVFGLAITWTTWGDVLLPFPKLQQPPAQTQQAPKVDPVEEYYATFKAQIKILDPDQLDDLQKKLTVVAEQTKDTTDRAFYCRLLEFIDLERLARSRPSR